MQRIAQSKNFKKAVILLFFTISGIVWLGLEIYGHYYISTEDAYVGANIVRISPQVTGKITKLYIENNQYVKKDQLLFQLDPTPFQAAVDSAQAQVIISEAELEKISVSAKRTRALVKRKFSSLQEGDNAIASLKTAIGNLQRAKAILAQENLNLQYTKITAPVSGWVSNVTLREGNIVPANQVLFALISEEKFWIDANFKETNIQGIKPGQQASIRIDMYPNNDFNGIVESISNNTGTAFSLLPPQNASGNWVKVTQRIPVRIRIINQDPRFPLRIGSSANVIIRLHTKITTS